LPGLLDTAGYSKAGVEALAHALRAEVAPHAAAVGIAHHWTGTDMIRDAERSAVRPVNAAACLVDGMEQRRTTVYAPAWPQLTQPVRAALPPVVLRASRVARCPPYGRRATP
jgi:NAD(P)-dependent dehydrogenase (short-subunit alcohol dehydrogenase family)